MGQLCSGRAGVGIDTVVVTESTTSGMIHVDFPPLPLWSSLSELSEMLPPRLQSSVCLFGNRVIEEVVS